MTTTLELINAISNGNAVEIETSFNAAMAEKVAAKLDDMRVNVAHAMFNAQVVEEGCDDGKAPASHVKAGHANTGKSKDGVGEPPAPKKPKEITEL